MEKTAKAAPAVTLEAVTVPLADGRRGMVLVLTDEYSRKTVMRAMPASRWPAEEPRRQGGAGVPFLFCCGGFRRLRRFFQCGRRGSAGLLRRPARFTQTSLDSLEKTSFAYST